MHNQQESTKKQSWPTKDALAVANCIFRNKGYTSTSVYLSDDPTNENRWNNKEMLMYHLMPAISGKDYSLQFSVTDVDTEQADIITKYFRRLSFGVIGDSLNDYMSRIFAITQKESVTIEDLGVLASIPYVYDKEVSEKEVMSQIKNTEGSYIGKPGDSVVLNLKYVQTKFLPKLNCFAHTAITDTNHLVSFLNKIELGQPGTKNKVKARIKNHTVNYHTKQPETQINYVKVVDNILVWQ
jgi:hypothetical protein